MTAGSSGPESADDVSVWYARTDDAFAPADRRTRALGWLQPLERTRYDRFRHDADRAMFLLGRVMARALVGRALDVAPTAWPWCDSPRGRPAVGMAACPLSFNLAHSGGLVACALAREGDVGVDVEDRARRILSPQLVSRFCSPDEQAAVAALAPDDRQDLFLKFWTLKEAYLKALGLGISVPLADLSFRLDGSRIELTPIRSLQGTGAHWTFDLRAVGASHYLAVAASSPHAAPRSITLAPFPDAWLP